MRPIMKLTRTIGPVFLLVVAAGCAAPSSTTQLESGAGVLMTAGDDVDLDRVVCHEVKPTGSRLLKKNCKTKREWQELAEANQEAVRNLERDTVRPSDQPSIGN